MAFADYVNQTYLPRAQVYLKASTFRSYSKDLAHLCDGLGSIPVSGITLRVVKEWTPKRRDNTPKTPNVDPFSADEQRRILAALEGHGLNLFQFAFWTGLRISELVALEWGDIDWIRGEATINKAITKASDEAEDTKTASGRRRIRLMPPAHQAILQQRALSLLHPTGRVFLNPRTGEPWEGDAQIRRTIWIPALKRAGVRYRYPYQTRHTWASMMLSSGENIAWVAKMMGHSDLNMVSRVYAKWIPDADPTAGAKALKLFWPAENTDQNVDHGMHKHANS